MEKKDKDFIIFIILLFTIFLVISIGVIIGMSNNYKNEITELNNNITELQQDNLRLATITDSCMNVLLDFGTGFTEYPLCEVYMTPYFKRSMDKLGEVVKQ